MEAAEVLERVATARRQVTQACHWLLAPSPDALGKCSEALGEAAAHLADCRDWARAQEGGPHKAAALEQVSLLRRDVLRAGGLLRSAFEYHARWNQVLGAMSGGYTSGGEAAAIARPARVSLRA